MSRCFASCVLVLTAGFVASAGAATIRHDVADSLYVTNAAKPRFQGVGRVIGPRYVGSGTYIGNSLVLTAGHITSPSRGNLQFEINGRRIPATRVVSHPQWNGSLISGVDLGLFQLASDPGVPAAPLNRSIDPLGLRTTITGFGTFGTGRTGEQYYDGIKRASRNVLDSRDFYGRNDILLSDFDSPNRGRFSTYGSADPLDREGLASSGDSGGPVWVEIGGDVLSVTGVVSFGWQGQNSNRNVWGDYGEGDGYVDITRHMSWIQSYLSGRGDWRSTYGLAAASLGADIRPLLMSIPEPTAGVLAVCAFGTLAWWRRPRAG
jgi:hypothetical protein